MEINISNVLKFLPYAIILVAKGALVFLDLRRILTRYQSKSLNEDNFKGCAIFMRSVCLRTDI